MPKPEIQRLVSLAFMAALLAAGQRGVPDVPAWIERVVVGAGATLVDSEDLSDPHAQRLRWRVRIGASWSDHREEVSRGLSGAGFRVEATDDALIARMATAGDTYLVEMRPISTEGPEPQQTVQIDFTGSPF